jgi:peptide subunit release factor 1 (eRF1)
MLITESSARIMGVNLGSIVIQLLRTRPELRSRVGREWSRDHYQDHRRERIRQFMHDQIRSVDQLLFAGGYGHLILAGNPRMVAAMRKALPKRIAAKLVSFVPACRTDNTSDIVAATLQSFLDYEETQSQAVADSLVAQIQRHGLAVTGADASRDAIKAGQADILVLLNQDQGQGWKCMSCGETDLERPRPNVCPKCRAVRLTDLDIRGELARLAEQRRVPIEVVEHSDALARLGGIGCLLRYSGPANSLYLAA